MSAVEDALVDPCCVGEWGRRSNSPLSVRTQPKSEVEQSILKQPDNMERNYWNSAFVGFLNLYPERKKPSSKS